MQLLLLIIAEIKRIYLAFILITNEYEKEIYCFSLEGVENITMAPNSTRTPWPGQKLRFVLIFPPLPDNATEFDLIEPSTDWKFKDIKCK